MSAAEPASSASSSIWKINRKLLPMKAHFFFTSSASAPINPFMPVYARQLGFSTVVVGIVYAILPYAALLSRVTFGYIADKFHKRKSLIIIMHMLMAGAFLGIKYIKPIPTNLEFEYQCDRIAAFEQLQFCPHGSDPDEATSRQCLLSQLQTYRGPEDHMQCTISCDQSSSTPNNIQVSLDHIRNVAEHNECLLFDIYHNSSHAQCLDDHTKCIGTCDNSNIQHLLGQHQTPEEATTSHLPPQLWLFATCMVFAVAGSAVVETLGLTVCYGLLGDNPHLFGRQRLWGSVGFGLVSLLGGVLLDRMSGEQQLVKDYSVAFYLMLACVAADLLVVGAGLRNVHTVRHPTAIVRNVGRMLLAPHCVVFLVWCAAVGVFMSLVWNFLFWHMEELAEADATKGEDCAGGLAAHMKTLQGLTMVVQMFCGEIPWFFASGALLRKIGHGNAMSLVLAALGVRLLLYSAVRNPWWVLPIGAMQGSYSVFLATMSSYACRVAPGGAEATVQSIAGAIFEGVGVTIGGLIGGVAMQRLGSGPTFRWFGCAALAMSALHVVVRLVLARLYPEVERATEHPEIAARDRGTNVEILKADEERAADETSDDGDVQKRSAGKV